MDELVLTVGDIKQFFYCPRIIFFRYLMPKYHPTTYKMQEGRLRQEEEQRLERRRSLSRFGFKGNLTQDLEGKKVERLFNLRLTSTRIGLSGVVDMAIVFQEEVIPVDFKDGAFSVGEVVPLHHKYQLLCYGLMLEEAYGSRCHRGYIHSLEDGKTRSIIFTDGAKQYLLTKLRKIRRMILQEEFPEESPYRGRCRECEFRPVCWG